MGIGMRELIIILLVVLLVFGAKKLRTIGSDLGAAVRGFKKAVNDGEAGQDADDDVKQIRAGEKDAEFPEVARRDAGSKTGPGA
ncbi:MAG: twin-arginine translocase TatA/TatE family subunit [Steroidobacteraceae bacterium]|nr:twin-arginine translocase TatA/TatE family subunit [Steroidobacteraceae bacterium]MCW5571995.1 twin-arginine translocase TatA/TatE family subunit [Steroidobacteraceae bacterium]